MRPNGSDFTEKDFTPEQQKTSSRIWLSVLQRNNQHNKTFCSYCCHRSDTEDTTIHYQNHPRLIQFTANLSIIDELCSLETQLALVLLIALWDEPAVMALPSIAEDLIVAPRNSAGFIVLHPPNDPTFYRWLDRVIYRGMSPRQTSLSLQDWISHRNSDGAAHRLSVKEWAGQLRRISGKMFCQTFTGTRPFPPGAGVYLLLAHVSRCHSEFSAGPFLPCRAHAAFPPNPKGLRGRAMTKVQATDGRRSPVLLLIAQSWPFRVLIGWRCIVAVLLSICTYQMICILYIIPYVHMHFIWSSNRNWKTIFFLEKIEKNDFAFSRFFNMPLFLSAV